MSNSDDVLIKVENVSKKFCRSLKRSMLYGIEDISRDLLHLPGTSDKLRKDEFWAVDDVSFEVKRGECLGIIGRNGAGKSTLLKMLNGIILPDKGKITIKGKVGALIEVGAGFHPMLTGRENVYVNGAILGMSRREIDKKFDEIVAFAELEEFIDMPVKHYSSGMYVRLGFAIAMQMEPDILILDEVMAVGDAGFKIKCYNKIFGIRDHTAIILVSHSMPQIGKVCTSGLVLKHGKTILSKDHLYNAIQTYYGQFDEANFSKEGNGFIEIESVNIYQNNFIYNYSIPWGNNEIINIDPMKEIITELTCSLLQPINRIVILWTFTDMDQKPVAQGISKLLEVPDKESNIKIRTRIDSLNLNEGKYVISLHIFDGKNGGWNLIFAGLRNLCSIYVKKETYSGAAPILYNFESNILNN